MLSQDDEHFQLQTSSHDAPVVLDNIWNYTIDHKQFKGIVPNVFFLALCIVSSLLCCDSLPRCKVQMCKQTKCGRRQMCAPEGFFFKRKYLKVKQFRVINSHGTSWTHFFVQVTLAPTTAFAENILVTIPARCGEPDWEANGRPPGPSDLEPEKRRPR